MKFYNFLKEQLRMGRYIFVMMLAFFSYNINEIASIGWGGWALYAATLAASIAGSNLNGGISAEEISKILEGIKMIPQLIPPKKRKNALVKGRKARKSKGAKP